MFSFCSESMSAKEVQRLVLKEETYESGYLKNRITPKLKTMTILLPSLIVLWVRDLDNYSEEFVSVLGCLECSWGPDGISRPLSSLHVVHQVQLPEVHVLW